MRKLLLLLLTASTVFAQNPSVQAGSVHFDNISHSAARVLWSPGSGSGNWGLLRFRYGTSDCTSGTGGTVTIMDNQFHKQGYSGMVGGLAPNTKYYVCPEGSSDGGNTYYGGVSGNFTTASLPSPHPALPVAPTRFTTDYPDTTGYSTPATLSSGGNCTDITSAINTAISNQKTTGTIINITAGSTCTGHVGPSTSPPDVVHLTSSAFNVSTSTITSASHGLNDGDRIVWGIGYGNIPGQVAPSAVLLNDYNAGPIVAGHPYWVHRLNDSQFQVYYGAPYGSSCQDETYFGNTCPHLWQFTDSGSGDIMYAKYPRNLKWIIVRTSTPDSQFLPEHVRANPNWAPLMAKLQAPNSYLGAYATCSNLLGLYGGDPCDTNGHYMLSNIRFVGLELTYQPYPQMTTTSDPKSGQLLIETGMDNSNIIFDRCYIHGYPTPFRVWRAIDWDGSQMAFVDSDIRDMNFWHAYQFGLNVHQ